MLEGTGSNLLVVCEVESEATLQQLVDGAQVRDDLVVTHLDDGADVRGFDCALHRSTTIRYSNLLIP